MTLKIVQIPSAKGLTSPLPEYATSGSAGLDLRACIDEAVTIAPGEICVIPTGLAFEIPAGNVGLLYARSGLGIKHGISLANGVGVIDCDYRGEVRTGLINCGAAAYTVEPGERICQLIITPYTRAELVLVESLDDTERGSGGYGSTGKK